MRAFLCRGGPASSLMFCTNGVLLRMLTQGEGLADVTHIIVDEARGPPHSFRVAHAMFHSCAAMPASGLACTSRAQAACRLLM
jgi:hypothetical protein